MSTELVNNELLFPLRRVRFLQAFAHNVSISISVHSLTLSVFHFKDTLFDKIIILLTFNSQPTKGGESACNAGDPDSIPGLGRSPGEGNGYPLHYSCLENPLNGGAW